MGGFLSQAFVYLFAAVAAVPIAKRLGLGSVLGYLVAGVLIGPVLGVVGAETKDLQHFAEFGVVMMLFLVGLELAPRALWQMRKRLFGLGGLQVGVTALAFFALGVLLGFEWRIALACGLIFSLSSTAIVLQTLNEKGLLGGDGGRASFSVLLFQDIAVIPMLALLPLLASPALAAAGGGHDEFSLVGEMSGWQVALVNVAAVAAVVAGGHYLSRPLFRYIAASRLREVFTAAALFIVVGIALLMGLVGLSPALGVFLAGVVLANSEYRHELESDIEPFKGLLLGLFFITVGASIDFGLLFDAAATVLAATVALVLIKAAVLFGLALIFNIRGGNRWLFSLGLAQGGEFCFVLLAFAVQNAVIPSPLADLLLLAAALSMLLTPGLFILFERFIAPRLAAPRRAPQGEEMPEQGAVIIAGHGRFGQIVNRLLRLSGYRTVVLDHRVELIEGVRKFGVRVFYGDATRPDLLHSAGLGEAKMLVVAIDDVEQAVALVRYARKENAGIHIIARARDRLQVYLLYNAGANDIIRETFDSALRAGRCALEGLGAHPYEAEKNARVFAAHDRETIRRLAAVWDPNINIFENEKYIALARKLNEQVSDAMATDRGEEVRDKSARSWTPPQLADKNVGDD